MAPEVKGVKLLISYDVKPDALSEYYRFMLGRYVPIMQELGLEMSDAWHTAYGDWPNRLIGFVTPEEDTLHAVLTSDIWDVLNEELQRYVNDFNYKVIPYQEGFQF